MPQLNDIGVKITAEVVNESGGELNVTGFTTKQIKVCKPSGDEFTRDATIEDGSDNKIFIKSEDGDLDETGVYTYQAILQDASDEYTSEEEFFRVHDNC